MPPFALKIGAWLSGKIIPLLLIAAIIGSFFYAYHYIDSNARADEVTKQDLAKALQDIKDLKRWTEAKESSDKVTQESLVTLEANQQDLYDEMNRRVKTTLAKVDAVRASTALTPAEKHKQMGTIYIDALTSNFCFIRPHRCKDGVPVPLDPDKPDIYTRNAPADVIVPKVTTAYTAEPFVPVTPELAKELAK